MTKTLYYAKYRYRWKKACERAEGPFARPQVTSHKLATSLSRKRYVCGHLFRLRPLACEQPHPDNEPQGGTNGQQIRAAAGLNGMLRTRGSGRAAGGRRPQAAEG